MKYYQDCNFATSLTYEEALVYMKEYGCIVSRKEWDGVHMFRNDMYYIITKDRCVIINPMKIENVGDNDWMVVIPNENCIDIMGKMSLFMENEKKYFMENYIERIEKVHIDVKKYELTEKNRVFRDNNLYRIKALKDFGNIKKGDLGGWIEKEDNLSQEGNCWVYHDAVVCDEAVVRDNAMVFDNAIVFDNAVVCDCAKIGNNAVVYNDAVVRGSAMVHGYAIVRDNSMVYGYAIVCDDAIVCDNATIYGYAKIYSCAKACGNAKVLGNAKVCGNAKVLGNAKVCGKSIEFNDATIDGNAKINNDAFISAQSDCLTISSIGSREDTTTFYKNKQNGINVNCGCFNGTIEEFEIKVKETHKGNEFEKQYLKAIEMAKIVIKTKDGKD